MTLNLLRLLLESLLIFILEDLVIGKRLHYRVNIDYKSCL